MGYWGNKKYLPKTGQTTSYLPGDDGDYKKGDPASPWFVDNGDGTITDRATQLMWVKDGTGAGCNNGAKVNWIDTLTFCNGLEFAGYSDWRLPNQKELQSIVDFSRETPALDPLFINSAEDYYWSSTTQVDNTGVAFTTRSVNGYYGVGSKEYANQYVRPVRGG